MYFKSTEKSDIADEYNVEMLDTKIVWRDWLRLWFNKDLKEFFSQKYLTYFICGVGDSYKLQYSDFYSFIENRRQNILTDLYEEDDQNPEVENIEKINNDNISQ